MSILELRILPPLAIARLGSSPEPLVNYRAVVEQAAPLGYRKIVPAPTLWVDRATGKITRRSTPKRVRFKDSKGRIHPVAPFLELWARLSGARTELVPLTTQLLKKEGLSPRDIAWSVEVANLKAVRRTRNARDGIVASVGPFSDHAVQPLKGQCANFKRRKTLPFGSVQYIRPSNRFPEIRLRFTPAAGKVYGPRKNMDTAAALYDSARGRWPGYTDSENTRRNPSATHTAPDSIYAGKTRRGRWVSDGYLDDECDGIVTASLTAGGKVHTAFARIGAGPPAFAPDSFPVRSIADELEQALLGPDVEPEDLVLGRAEEIVRRAAETVRLLNTAVLNGNEMPHARASNLNTMPAQDEGSNRVFEPIASPPLVDNLSVVALHQSVLSTIRSGSAPWFVDVLRRYDEVADLTTLGRRKMPAMMRGADGNYLALTRRQRDMIAKIAVRRSADPGGTDDEGAAAGPGDHETPPKLEAKNLTAQLYHHAAGNPPGSRPDSAISNCFPGLEFDFRNVWSRAFVGIVLSEHDNLIVAVEDQKRYGRLLHRRILRVDGDPIVIAAAGPGAVVNGVQTSIDPPAAPLEWSNAIARVQHEKAGQMVRCEVTRAKSLDATTLPPAVPGQGTKFVQLEVRRFFAADTAVIDRERVQPGELTQSLCSPWQNDYRECACYYWASSRPDYVNVEPTDGGQSRGHNWMQKNRRKNTPRTYEVHDTNYAQLVSYKDLFRKWEHALRFEIEGKDAD